MLISGYSLYTFIGLCSGFLSGLLGIGGAIILIPMVLTLPELFGFTVLNMHQIAALSLVHVFAASLSSAAKHRESGTMHSKIVLLLGIPFAGANIVGAILSTRTGSHVLLGLFGILLILALILLWLPEEGRAGNMPVALTFPRQVVSSILAFFIGILSGMVGIGGGILLIPLMLQLLRLPIRTAIGCSAGIIFIGSFSGALGKIISGQVFWPPTLAVMIGALISARAGAILNKRVAQKNLKMALAVVLVFASFQVWKKYFIS